LIHKKLSKNQIILGLSAAIIVVFILSFYIWHQTESIRLGYKVQKLEHTAQNLQKEIRKLETIKASYLALEKVEKIARDDLKLSPTREDQIIYDDGLDPIRKESP